MGWNARIKHESAEADTGCNRGGRRLGPGVMLAVVIRIALILCKLIALKLSV
jgi:hypothetical protein